MMHPTVDDFINAYDKTGLEPRQHVTYSPTKHCGCAVGALGVARGIDNDDILSWFYRNVDNTSYADGIIHGFDADPFMFRLPGLTKEYMEGYEVGTKVKHIMIDRKQNRRELV